MPLHVKIHILVAFLVLSAAGCVRMPVPTAGPPQSAGAKTSPTSATPRPAPALTPTRAAAPGQALTPAGPGNAANGARLFAQQPCSSCHDVTKPFPGGVIGPNLGNIATEAERIVQSPEYNGAATDAAGYIRESIVDPNAYVVPGDVYHTADGQSVMPKNFADTLTPTQTDDLVAYLLTLK